jgi:hypothetical protein
MRGTTVKPGPTDEATEAVPPRAAAQPAATGVGAMALRSPAGFILAALGMIVCVGVADYLTGTDTSLILFYLAPIGFGTWYVSLRGGVFLAVAAAAVSVGADALHRLGAGEGDLPFALLGWNGVVQAGTPASRARSCSPAPTPSPRSRTGAPSSRSPRSRSSAPGETAGPSRSPTWTATTSRT